MADSILDDRTLEALHEYANQTGQSINEVARKAIDHYLRDKRQPSPSAFPYPEDEPLLALSGVGRSGQSDVSERTNEILRQEIDSRRGWTFKRDRTD